MCYSRKIKDNNFEVTTYVKTFIVKPSTFSNLDPVSSYDVRFLCNLYGRKARTESYNFRVGSFSKIWPESGQTRQFQQQNLEISGNCINFVTCKLINNN